MPQIPQSNRARLDPRESMHLIDGPRDDMRLFVRHLAAASPVARPTRSLLLHGATFPSALSIAYRFNGRSWRDALCDAGFDVWAFDFYGFGGSDRYPEMDLPADSHAPLGRAADAVHQLEAVVRFVLRQQGAQRISLITHSWGSMPAGLLAASHPTLVDRIFMFAPLACREGPRYTPLPSLPAWKIVTNEDQWQRFVEDVPDGEPSCLVSSQEFDLWGRAYLDGTSDPEGSRRDPPGVKTPTGPLLEILHAWHGKLAWQPDAVESPVAIARGAWDGLVTDADAHWLFQRLTRARERRDVKIARGTHLMHLEQMRTALWAESIAFLRNDHLATGRNPSITSGDTFMQDHHEAKDLAGYNPGAPEVAKSPITLEELRELKASALFTDEDMVYLRLSYEVLKDQAEDLVTMWRGIIAQHTHLARYSFDRETGKPDKEYGERVGKRFAQWVLDTARAEYDQTWLDYQYEIGLRHHRDKKNQTDQANTTPHIRGRDLIAFAARRRWRPCVPVS